MSIEEIVDHFTEGGLAIDYSEADEDEMIQLEDVLDQMTDKRPHDEDSYSQHMMRFVREGYGILVCDEFCASSYRMGVSGVREITITLQQVLEAAGVIVKGESVSETDFAALF